MLLRSRTEVFGRPITDSMCSFSVFKAVKKSDVYHHFCCVHNLHLPPARYALPSSYTSILAIPSVIKGSPAAEFCLRCLSRVKMTFVTITTVSVWHEINFPYTQTFNFKEYTFKILLLRGIATWHTKHNCVISSSICSSINVWKFGPCTQ